MAPCDLQKSMEMWKRHENAQSPPQPNRPIFCGLGPGSSSSCEDPDPDFILVKIDEEGADAKSAKKSNGRSHYDLDHEKAINTTKQVLERYDLEQVLERHRCKGHRDRRAKKYRNSRNRKDQGKKRDRGAKRDPPLATPGPLLLDNKGRLCQVEVDSLRFSQMSCKHSFHCGRTVSGLVDELLNQKISVDADFLRLTVFETVDQRTNQRILKCIDNRRLLALKTYAALIQEDVMININFYSMNTLGECQRFLQNTDDTAGLDIRVRFPQDSEQTMADILIGVGVKQTS